MTAFQRVYSRELEDAAVKAALDRGVGPTRVIQEDIQAGRFQSDGVTFPAQNVPLDTVRAWVREEKKRRAGLTESPLSKMPHRDAVEVLRTRLLNAADTLLRAEERKGTKADPARMQAVGRLIREAAAIPEQAAPRPPKPGHHIAGESKQSNGDRDAGLAGQIIRAHARSTQTIPDTTTTPSPSTNNPLPTDTPLPGTEDSEEHGAVPTMG